MVLIISIIISVSLSAYWIHQHSQKKKERVQFEERFSDEPVELDPIEDAVLTGPHHWARLELFDLMQKGYVETTRSCDTPTNTNWLTATSSPQRGGTVTKDVFRLSNRSSSADPSLSPVQQKIISQFKELDAENEGVGGGTILHAVELWEEIDTVIQEKKAKYEEAGLAYPEKLTEDGCGGCVGCGGLALLGLLIIWWWGFEDFLEVLDGDSGLVLQGVAAIFILCIPGIIKFRQDDLPEHPPKAKASMALLREKWQGKTITTAALGDLQLQRQNLMIMGALGTGALAGSAYASFGDVFGWPSTSVGGGSNNGGCSSCSSCRLTSAWL